MFKTYASSVSLSDALSNLHVCNICPLVGANKKSDENKKRKAEWACSGCKLLHFKKQFCLCMGSYWIYRAIFISQLLLLDLAVEIDHGPGKKILAYRLDLLDHVCLWNCILDCLIYCISSKVDPKVLQFTKVISPCNLNSLGIDGG